MSSARRARGTTPVPRSNQPQHDSTLNSNNGGLGEASMASAPPSTPATAGAASLMGRSPLVAARLEEKNFLVSCNNKLAAYIDRNRQLENENQRITSQLTTIQTTHTEETTHIREVYERELEETRKTLDKVSTERAQLQLENAKLHTENNEVKQKLNQVSTERDAVQQRADNSDSRAAEAQRRAVEAEQARQQAAKDLADALRNNANTERTLADAQEQLEKETLARVEAQNLLQSTIERANFQENLLKQQITEARTSQEATVTKISKELEEEYDSRLEEALENMRSQYADQLNQIRSDVDRQHQSRANELRQQAERLMAEARQARSELSSSKIRIEDLLTQVSGLQSQNQHLNSRLRDAENSAEGLKNERDEQHAKLVAEIDRLNDELNQLRQEHAELLESRITIDMELQAYRKMLEAEEERISPHGLTRPRKRARRGAETPSSPVGTSGHDISAYSSQTQKTEVRFTAQQHVSGSIEITDIDPDGKFIRLANVGDGEISMSGWQFKLSGGDLPDGVSHKFSRGFILAPHNACTVWANSKVAPSPMPDHDVLSRPSAARFPAPTVENPSVRAILQDNNPSPNVVADVEVRREVVVVGSEVAGAYGDSPSGENRQQCALM